MCGAVIVCGTGGSNFAVCEKSASGSATARPVGVYPSTLVAGGSTNNPSAVFSMSFTKATGSIYTVYIDFTCGTTAGAPVYSKEGGGSMYFAWSTMYACSAGSPTTAPTVTVRPPTVPPPASECGYYNSDGQYFDVSAVGDRSVLQTSTVYTIYFNLCKPLTSPTKDLCIAGKTFACQNAVSTTTTSNSAASVKPTKGAGSNGALQLVFTNGTNCPGQPGAPNRGVTFNLACGTTVGSPVFVSEVACHFTIAWTSSFFCPIDPPAPVVPACVFDFPSSDNDLQIDLRPLADKVWSTPNSEYPDNVEHIGMCGTEVSSSIAACPAGSTVCESGGSLHLSYGQNPFSVWYSGDSLFYQYSAASSSCRFSTIEFVCDPEASDDAGPVHTANSADHCEQSFLWKSKLACPKKTCHPTVDGHAFDLSGLLGTTHSVPNPFVASSTAHLALCGEIVTSVPECANAGWPACQTADGVRPLQLGAVPVSYSLSAASTLLAAYSYANPFTTTIEFICDEAVGLGEPELVSIGAGNSSYHFVWAGKSGCVV